VSAAIDGTEFRLEHEALVPGVPSFEIASDAELVRALEAISGQAADAVLFATEAPFYAALGLETVVLGPGDIRVAHQPNEHTTREALVCATDLYAKMIGRFCVEDPT
jgi:acetylornithine deacetylase